jgi:hypothetical protein
MALSTKHRLALYEHFQPHVGDEVTEALLAEFPARDGDELVTKDFLRAETAELRAEVHEGFARTDRHITNVIVGMTSVFVVAIGIATTLIIAFGD